jgi:hypothetical protein
LWLLEFEIARVRQRVEECMKEVYAAIKDMEEVTTYEYAKMVQ